MPTLLIVPLLTASTLHGARLKVPAPLDKVVFATLKQGYAAHATLNDEITTKICQHIGSFVKPSRIYYIKQLPKTRSGKIMCRLLKGILDGKSLGDVSTLEDQASLDEIKSMYEQVHTEVTTQR